VDRRYDVQKNLMQPTFEAWTFDDFVCRISGIV